MKKIISLLMVFAFIFAFAACGNDDKTKTKSKGVPTNAVETQAETDTQKEDTITEPETIAETVEPKGTLIGTYDEGEIAIYVDVINKAGETFTFTVYTDKTHLGPALVSKSLIDGVQGQYGLEVKTVNGETHNYETEGYAWMIYVDGKQAETGVDSIELKEGSTYTFKVETF